MSKFTYFLKYVVFMDSVDYGSKLQRTNDELF